MISGEQPVSGDGGYMEPRLRWFGVMVEGDCLIDTAAPEQLGEFVCELVLAERVIGSLADEGVPTTEYLSLFADRRTELEDAVRSDVACARVGLVTGRWMAMITESDATEVELKDVQTDDGQRYATIGQLACGKTGPSNVQPAGLRRLDDRGYVMATGVKMLEISSDSDIRSQTVTFAMEECGMKPYMSAAGAEVYGVVTEDDWRPGAAGRSMVLPVEALRKVCGTVLPANHLLYGLNSGASLVMDTPANGNTYHLKAVGFDSHAFHEQRGPADRWYAHAWADPDGPGLLHVPLIKGLYVGETPEYADSVTFTVTPDIVADAAVSQSYLRDIAYGEHRFDV